MKDPKVLLSALLEKQNELNNLTNGEEWTSGFTNIGKVINWDRCMYMESCELMDSFPWKHWKDVSKFPDLDNARIEVVDLWHFLLSKTITLGAEDQVLHAITGMKTNAVSTQVQIGSNLILELNDSFLRAINGPDVVELMNRLIELQAALGMSLKEVHDLYMIKNFLNRFRQENGYAEGTYIKHFNVTVNGELSTWEDNTLLVKYVDKEKDLELGITKFKEAYKAYDPKVGITI